MPAPHLQFENVSFTYPSAVETLFAGLSLRCDRGWTGIVGANGAGKTTFLRLAIGELTPTVGAVRTGAHVVCCPQRTDDPPPELPDFFAADDKLAFVLRGQLGLDDAWPSRWSTLSHGERKRAQLACALWRQPDVLALDEPTNHVDAAGRALILQALRAFNGVGLLVSHDRELLDALCTQCLMLTPPNAVLRPGNYSAASGQARLEHAAARHEREERRRELKRLKQEATRRRAAADAADARRSKRGIAAKDHDAKARIDLARVTGKDGQAGRRLSQLAGRMRQAQEAASAAHVPFIRDTGMTLPGDRARRSQLVRIAAGELPLGPGRTLHLPELLVLPDDRIGVSGPNGAGKSTLIGYLMSQLSLPPETVVYIPQEVTADAARELLGTIRATSPADRGRLLTYVGALGSDPRRLLDSETPSPGEVRKLLLALGMLRTPHLIVMDEPTNHLDLPSVECFETALRECGAALVLVSHDMRLLDALTPTRWMIAADPDSSADTRLHITRTVSDV